MKRFIIFVLVCIPTWIFAQIGGEQVYSFVKIPASAIENIIGTANISYNSKDVATALKNPSIVDSTYNYGFNGTWGGLYVIQTEIGLGSFSYAQKLNSDIMLHGGLYFLNYGRFEGFDEEGLYVGNFLASDYVIVLGASRSIFNFFTVGVNLKPIISQYDTYTSFGLLGDFAFRYASKDNSLQTSIVVRNFGYSLTHYTSNKNEPIPFSLDWGVSKKLKHAPFTISYAYSDIQKFDLLHEDNTVISTITNTEVEENVILKTSKNLLKHSHFAVSFSLLKKVDIFIGYNNRKMQELALENAAKGVGFGLGFSVKTGWANLSYGWSKQHTAGGTQFLSVTTDCNKLYKKFVKPHSL